VASKLWGGSWRIPTNEEWTALREQCTWNWTTQNGVNGRLVTAANGNSIFLPAAGKRTGYALEDVGMFGYYWSSSLTTTGGTDVACEVYFYSGNVDGYFEARNYGLSVRPVFAY
ncbi:MAG: hypothetical protein K6A64_09460, partial [Bacteroidales bacterium]|nr:hypothetical protein [Bacteroidales bacterium]